MCKQCRLDTNPTPQSERKWGKRVRYPQVIALSLNFQASVRYNYQTFVVVVHWLLSLKHAEQTQNPKGAWVVASEAKSMQ